MVSSGAVNQVSSDLSSKFTNYQNQISGLSSSWKGSSFDNLNAKAEEFVGEYESAITSQLSSFAEAVSLYEQYVVAKKNVKISEGNYNMAVQSDNQEAIAKFSADIAKYKKQMAGLKVQIESALQSARTPVLESSNASSTPGEFVNYYQTDYPNVAYSNYGTIKSHGCGPTSLAMVLTYLLDEEITPIETTKAAEVGGYTSSNGTYHSYFGAMADKYGVECEQIDGATREQIATNLNEDKTIILLTVGRGGNGGQAQGTFTSGGHFIVVRGIDENGQAIIADPASRNKTDQTWDLNVLARESTRMWSYENE